MLKSRIVLSIWIITALLYFVIVDSWIGPALFVIIAIMLTMCFVISRISGRNVCFEVMISEKKKDDKLHVISFFQKNNSFIPLFSFSMDIIIHNITTGESVHQKIWKNMQYELESENCGCVEVRIEKITIFDYLGFFKRTEQSKTVEIFYIPPKIKPIDLNIDEFDSYDLDSYEFSLTQKGDDPSEVFDLREYGSGDKMKSIHWKLSSKMDEIIIKEHSFPIDNRTILILNNSIVESDGLTPAQRNDLVVLFVSISGSLVDKGIKHAVCWYDHYHKNFITENVASMDDLWNTMPGILRAGYGVDPIGIPYHYIEQMERNNFSNYVYVTEDDMRETERLEELGAVKIFTSAAFR